jgi:hypothetical protein
MINKVVTKTSLQMTSRSLERRGTAVAELAVACPLLMLIVLGSLEFGREAMVRQSLEDAARGACRVLASRDGTEEAAVSVARTVLEGSGIRSFDLQVLSGARGSREHNQPIKTEIRVRYEDVAWINFIGIRSRQFLTGSCTFPSESRN